MMMFICIIFFITFSIPIQKLAILLLKYHGGVVFVKEVNKSHLLANSVLCFMTVTLFGGPTFLCKMQPVRELDAKFLFEQTSLVIEAIKCAGRNLVVAISGGSSQSVIFKMFDIVKPWLKKDNKFLLSI